MGERRLLWVVLGALMLVLSLPALASAASYDWDQPANFTSTGSGANPDHDSYGATPWSYDAGPECALPLCTPDQSPSNFTRLSNFDSGTWSDGVSHSIGVGAPGALQMAATSTGVTALGWTNPLGRQAEVNVTGTIGTGSGTCAWSLAEGGTAAASGTGSGSIAEPLTVPAGGSIYLTINAAPSALPATCSASVTLHIDTPMTPVTLSSPATAGPLTDPTPKLTGQSGGDATAVTIAVYSGAAVAGSPVRVLSASRNVTTGTFATTITPPLPDGEYTAIAGQRGSQPGASNLVTFRIKADAPALTVAAPRRGGSVFGPRPTFSGRGGSSLGDAPTVSLTLHRGSSSSGANLGTERAAVSGGSWTLKWAKALANGFYTLVAQQRDDAGHTRIQYITFVVVPAPPVIGPRVSLRGATAGVAITCTAPSGMCVGSVLALSTTRLQTRSGSPVGFVRVLFVYARIEAGRTATVRMSLPGYVAAALRRVHKLQVRVSVSMIGIGRTSATRSVAS